MKHICNDKSEKSITAEGFLIGWRQCCTLTLLALAARSCSGKQLTWWHVRFQQSGIIENLWAWKWEQVKPLVSYWRHEFLIVMNWFTVKGEAQR